MEAPRRARLAASSWAPRWLPGLAAATTILAALSIALLDQPVARWLAGFEPLALWDRGLDGLEWLLLLPAFKLASAMVLVLGMVVAVAVPRWRNQAPVWMYLAGVHVISRFMMIHLKDATGRLRPTEWLRRGGATFWRDDGISFPSGHVVLFASIVIPVIVIWPRTRPLIVIVGFVMLARLAANAHFVSDVIAGVSLVTVVAWALGCVLRPRTR